MLRPKLFVCIAALTVTTSGAFAYGPKGHTIVGAIADIELANHKAGQAVKTLLGDELTLADVATWADDIKSGPTGDKDMDAFLKAHSKNVAPHKTEHKQFHFVDIPFEEKAYSETSIGAKPYDLVHAINDCIFILQQQKTGERPKDGYFDDVPPRVALILLTHYIGDLHQPLHVGSGYLTPSHEFINPDKEKGVDFESDEGGNKLQFMSGELHAFWDTGAVVKAMAAAGVAKRQNALTAYAAILQTKGPVAATSGDPKTWSAKWATEILPLAAQAHDLVVTGKTTIKGQHGPVEVWATKPGHGAKDWKTYEKDAADAVEKQITKAGFRLAQICKEIWPDN